MAPKNASCDPCLCTANLGWGSALSPTRQIAGTAKPQQVGPANATDGSTAHRIAWDVPEDSQALAFELTISCLPTIGAATATYLHFDVNSRMGQDSAFTALNTNKGPRFLAPGQTVVIQLANNRKRITLDSAGLQSDFLTPAAVSFRVELREQIATPFVCNEAAMKAQRKAVAQTQEDCD
jgi:hypothetical protein